MGRQPPTEQEYDILIIGAGPSAAGLLYGILHRILLDRGSSSDDDQVVSASSSSNLSCVRIAILERGNNADIINGNNIIACASDDESTANNNNVDMSTASQFEHGHPSTCHLQNWFQTAHYNNNNIPSHSHPTILHTTTPQRNLHNRIIDVPTGSGWGGGTNINAGLVMQPDNFRDDFDNWPGRWRGGDLIFNSIEEMLNVMKKNEGLCSESTSLLDDELLQNEDVHVCAQEDGSGENYCSSFQHPTLSSTPNSSSSKRVNYFTSLIAPLLQRHPELCKNVTFLSGVQVERILIRYSCCAAGDEDDNVCTHTQQQQQQQQKKHPCKPQAWAVECNYGDHYRGIIRSKRDIILCSGAIATPSLLLASGIGTEDDLTTAGIVPWYEQIKCDIHDAGDDDAQSKNVHRNLLVGHNLRDHILLPRIFITPRLYNFGEGSYNSILGWWMIRNSISSSIDAKMQLQLADGIQMDYMIPHFAAGALRRRWVFPFAINLPQAWIESLFVVVRMALRVIFCIPLLSKWVKQHFVSFNLCLLNPKSTGRVTVRSSKGIQTHTRLSDCKVIIDPNYLSDSGDVESLWRGWTCSSIMKQRWFKRGIDILPGYTFSIGVAACSLIRSAIHWAKALLGWKLHDVPNEIHSGGNAPLWFRKYAAEFSNPYYHWCGTCAMGGEEDSTSATTSNGESVVDEHLCVRGLSNLRICDASVFPDSVSAPPALTCASLGHAASSFIIE